MSTGVCLHTFEDIQGIPCSRQLVSVCGRLRPMGRVNVPTLRVDSGEWPGLVVACLFFCVALQFVLSTLMQWHDARTCTFGLRELALCHAWRESSLSSYANFCLWHLFHVSTSGSVEIFLPTTRILRLGVAGRTAGILPLSRKKSCALSSVLRRTRTPLLCYTPQVAWRWSGRYALVVHLVKATATLLHSEKIDQP